MAALPRVTKWVVVAFCILAGLLVALNYEYSGPKPYVPMRLKKVSAEQPELVRLWFFATGCDKPYLDFLVKAAVLSARHHTNLLPVAMMHCQNPALESWLIDHGVTIRDPGNDRLVQFLDAHPHKVPRLGSSAWYRIAIPTVIDELVASKHELVSKISPNLLNYVLYTDTDIVFTNNIAFQEYMLPRYVGLPIQGDFWCCSKNPYSSDVHTNDGIILMNVTSFREVQGEFTTFIEKEIMRNKDDDPSSGLFNDQTAFHDFFPIHRPHVPWFEMIHMSIYYTTYFKLMFTKYYADRLPKEYGWEPYLGVNPNAVLVHWHGPKVKVKSCSQLRPHAYAANNLSYEVTYHTHPELNASLEVTVTPMMASGPTASLFNAKIMRQLLIHNRTAVYVPAATQRPTAAAPARPAYPAPYDWYPHMQLQEQDRAEVVSKGEEGYQFLQTLTGNSLQGYHHATNLYLAYMNEICSQPALSKQNQG